MPLKKKRLKATQPTLQDTIVDVSRISCQNESQKIKFLPVNNGPFSSRPKPLFQSEAKCEAIDLKITLICARK